jgi:succinate dehydrogenase/fumarate reductase flavoprotein subunit
VVSRVRQLVLPYEINYLRHESRLTPALQELHQLWDARGGEHAVGEDQFRAREATAMLAHARWMYHAALERTESRGMHRRFDYTDLDPAQEHRLITGGLDTLWSRPEPLWLSEGRAA